MHGVDLTSHDNRCIHHELRTMMREIQSKMDLICSGDECSKVFHCVSDIRNVPLSAQAASLSRGAGKDDGQN
jgi:hypothetical protein